MRRFKKQTYNLKDIMEAVKSEKLDDDFVCMLRKMKLNFQDGQLPLPTLITILK